MNQTKRNEILEFCESLTHHELTEFCKKLIAENEELIAENHLLEEFYCVFAMVYGEWKVVIERR